MKRSLTRRRSAWMGGWLALAIFCIALPCPGRAAADEAEGAPPAETTATNSTDAAPPPVEVAPPSVKIIPLEEITVRSQSALQEIRELEPSEQTPELASTIAQQLPATSQSLDRIDLEIQSVIQSGRVGRRIRRIEDDMSIVTKRLDDWQESLVSQIRGIQERLARIDETETLWVDTRDSIADEEGADSLNETIGTVLDAATKSKGLLTQLRDDSLEAQAKISHQVNRFSTLRENLTRLNELTRKQLFHPDSPFIWNIRKITREDGAFSEQISIRFRNDAAVLGDLVKTHPVNLIIQLLILVATAVFLFKVRQRHQDTLKNDPRTKSAAKLLNHPIATGIVIALVLTPLLIPTPPLAYYRYAVFALLIPVVILLRTTLRDEFKRPAYLVISLYLLIRISTLLPEFSFGQRMIVLVVAVVGALSSFRQIRRSRTVPETAQRRFTFEMIISRVGFVFYCAAALLNVFGMFSLADKLLSTLVAVLTLALILISGSNAIREFLRISMVVGPLKHLSAVKYHYAVIDRNVTRVLNFAAYLLGVLVALLAIGILGPTREIVIDILNANWQIGALSLSIGSILAFVFAIWVSVLLSKSIRFVLTADILPRFDLPRGIPSSISMMLHYCIITLGLLFALAAAGVNLSQLSILVGALGVGIGFGLQSLVNNFVSGLILIFERPIKVGDKIQFGTNFGEVRSIGIRASNVRSFDGAEVIVPNGNLISNEVINWTLSDQQRRMDINVGVAYGNDPEKVIELLGHVLEPFDKILKDPEPFISFDGFGESSLDFTVRFWIDDFQLGLRMKSAISIAINKALKEAKIEIPFPQRDLHLRSIDDAPARTLGATHKKKSDTDLLP